MKPVKEMEKHFAISITLPLLTETILLGNLAFRVGHKIEWDAKKMDATNTNDASTIYSIQVSQRLETVMMNLLTELPLCCNYGNTHRKPLSLASKANSST